MEKIQVNLQRFIYDNASTLKIRQNDTTFLGMQLIKYLLSV